MSFRVIRGGRADVDGLVPQHNLKAEVQVLVHGIDNRTDVAVAVGMGLEPRHFFDPAHARIWEAILAVASAPDSALSYVSVHEWLRAREWLTAIGGDAYLKRVADEIGRAGPMRSFVKPVLALARVRAIQAEAHAIAAEGYGDVGDPDEWCDSAPARIERTSGGRSKTPQSFATTLKTSWETLTSGAGQRGGYATGLEVYDAATGGLHPGEVLLVSAKEKAGKSMLVGQWFAHIAGRSHQPLDEHGQPAVDARGKPVLRRRAALIFALDSAKQSDWAERVAGAYVHADLERFRVGTANDRDREALARGIEWANGIEVHVDSEEIGSVGQMGARVRALRDELAARDVDLVAVGIDYIQLAAGVGSNREEQIGNAMRGVVKLAGQEDLRALSWVVIAQTNSEGELTHCRALAKMADAWIHLAVDEEKPSESWWHDTAQGGEVVTTYPATISVNRSRRGAQGKRAKPIALWVCYRFTFFYAGDP